MLLRHAIAARYVDCHAAAGRKRHRSDRVGVIEQSLRCEGDPSVVLLEADASMGIPEPSELASTGLQLGAAPFPGYDRILVDTECTHDGSIPHLLPPGDAAASGDGASPIGLNYNLHDLESLYSLQARLLEQGFAALRPGGTLVYSTCTHSRQQCEDIVSAFLRRHQPAGDGPFLSSGGVAELVHPFAFTSEELQLRSPLLCLQTSPTALNAAASQRRIWADELFDLSAVSVPLSQTAEGLTRGYVVRLSPRRSATSAQFIAKIRKVS